VADDTPPPALPSKTGAGALVLALIAGPVRRASPRPEAPVAGKCVQAFRFTVFRLHPNAPAIRFVPQPNRFNYTIDATSSGQHPLPPRIQPRGELCPSNISVIPPPSGGVSF
jgi:hypothetical protein